MQSLFDFVASICICNTYEIYRCIYTYINVYIREIAIIIKNFTDTALRQSSLICYDCYANFIKTKIRETNIENEIYICYM